MVERCAIAAAALGLLLPAAPAGAEPEPTLAEPGSCAQVEREVDTGPVAGAPGIGGVPREHFERAPDPRGDLDRDAGVIDLVLRVFDGGKDGSGGDGTRTPKVDAVPLGSMVGDAVATVGETGGGTLDAAADASRPVAGLAGTVLEHEVVEPPTLERFEPALAPFQPIEPVVAPGVDGFDPVFEPNDPGVEVIEPLTGGSLLP